MRRILRISVTLKVILWCICSCTEKTYKVTLQKQWNWSGWRSPSLFRRQVEQQSWIVTLCYIVKNRYWLTDLFLPLWKIKRDHRHKSINILAQRFRCNLVHCQTDSYIVCQVLYIIMPIVTCLILRSSWHRKEK